MTRHAPPLEGAAFRGLSQPICIILANLRQLSEAGALFALPDDADAQDFFEDASTSGVELEQCYRRRFSLLLLIPHI